LGGDFNADCLQLGFSTDPEKARRLRSEGTELCRLQVPVVLAMLTERPVTHARGGAEGRDDGRDDARHNLKCELPSFFSFHSSSNSFKFIDYD
jgi:hypothetical protein